MVITETWLTPTIPDEAIKLAGRKASLMRQQTTPSPRPSTPFCEQPEPQHQKNKRTDHRLQEEAGHTHSNTHQWRDGGEIFQLQIHGHTHLSELIMDNKHHSNSKESTAAVIHSLHTQESQSLTTATEVLLSLLH